MSDEQLWQQHCDLYEKPTHLPLALLLHQPPAPLLQLHGRHRHHLHLHAEISHEMNGIPHSCALLYIGADLLLSARLQQSCLCQMRNFDNNPVTCMGSHPTCHWRCSSTDLLRLCCSFMGVTGTTCIYMQRSVMRRPRSCALLHIAADLLLSARLQQSCLCQMRNFDLCGKPSHLPLALLLHQPPAPLLQPHGRHRHHLHLHADISHEMSRIPHSCALLHVAADLLLSARLL